MPMLYSLWRRVTRPMNTQASNLQQISPFKTTGRQILKYGYNVMDPHVHLACHSASFLLTIPSSGYTWKHQSTWCYLDEVAQTCQLAQWPITHPALFQPTPSPPSNRCLTWIILAAQCPSFPWSSNDWVAVWKATPNCYTAPATCCVKDSDDDTLISKPLASTDIVPCWFVTSKTTRRQM